MNFHCRGRDFLLKTTAGESPAAWERSCKRGIAEIDLNRISLPSMETAEKGRGRLNHPRTFLLALRTGLLLVSASQPFSGLLFVSQNYRPNFPFSFHVVTAPPMVRPLTVCTSQMPWAASTPGHRHRTYPSSPGYSSGSTVGKKAPVRHWPRGEGMQIEIRGSDLCAFI